MRYLSLFFIFLSTLFAHGKEHDHMHFFGSLHEEYFLLFILGLLGAVFVYLKYFRERG